MNLLANCETDLNWKVFKGKLPNLVKFLSMLSLDIDTIYLQFAILGQS